MKETLNVVSSTDKEKSDLPITIHTLGNMLMDDQKDRESTIGAKERSTREASKMDSDMEKVTNAVMIH